MIFIVRRQEWFFRGYFLVFFWFLQGSFTEVNSQTFAFQHITEKEGLPSTYLYGILQDKEGYIWLTGESGVHWYDGQKYYRPSVQDEFKDEIIRFFNNGAKEVLMQDLAGRLLLYKEEEIREFSEVKPDPIYKYTELYNHPNGDIWIANTESVFIYKMESDSLIRLQVDNENQVGNENGLLVSIKTFGETRDGKTILFVRDGYFTFEGVEYHFTFYKNKKRLRDFTFGFNIGYKTYLVLDNKIYSYDLETQEFIPEFEELNQYFKTGIVEVYQDSDGDLWFATQDGLVLLSKQENGEYVVTRHLEGEVMGGVMEDNDGSIWFITDQNGIFMLPSKDIKVYSKNGLDNPIRFIKQDAKKQLVLGFDNNQFKTLDDSFNEINSQKLYVENNRLYDYAVDSLGDQYFATSTGYARFDEDYQFIEKSYEWSLKASAFTPDGRLWFASGGFFGYAINARNAKRILKKRSYSLFPVSNDEVWVGTIDGPFLYKNGDCTKIDHPDLNHDIRDIQLIDEDLLLLATQKNGTYCYAPSIDSVLHHFSLNTGLSSNNCSKMFVDENFIWLGTKKGINKINRSDFSITIIGVDQGLPSNEVNYIHKDEGQIYVATNRGIAVFDESLAFPRIPPPLQITNIKIEEKDTIFLDQYRLGYAENNIKIEFKALTFKDAEQVVYQYKMAGIDQDWIESKVSIAQYPSLPSGDYTFFVKTKSMNSDWSPEKTVAFQIETPYYRTVWFYFLVGLLVLGIFYLIFSEIDRRRSIARDLKASRLTALRAQMNPHFIFNALNSIQEFIVNKDTRSANRYLTRFAKLMRNILNVSDKDRISLSKEIESLNFYLSLEALRFGESFEYILEVDNEIDKDALYLPPMLIQPFVENAIKRGLMHQEGEKKLYLRFYIKNDFLMCEVEDNGVGRKKSAEIRKQNTIIYPSKATSLINERLKLFNSISKNSLSIEVVDLKDELSVPVGTKVILTINTNFKGF